MELNKKRSFKEVINDTFTFFHENYKMLLLLVFLFASPFALVSGYFYSNIELSKSTGEIFGNPVYNHVGYFVTLVLANVMLVLTVYGYVYFYIKLGKGNFSKDDVWKYIVHNFGKILGAVFFIVFFLIIGFLLLVIPGIYLLVVLIFMFPVLLFEQTDYPQAFMRCFFLTKDRWWYTMGLIFFVNLIVLMFSMLFMIPEFVFSFILKAKVGDDLGQWPLRYAIIVTLTQFIVFFLQVFPQVAVILQYFNLSKEKEEIAKKNQTNHDATGDNLA
jgi:hypothetical protein